VAELTAPVVLVGTGVAAATVVLGSVALSARRPRASGRVVRVAHSARLRALPSYRRAVVRRRTGLVATAVLLLATLAVSGYLAARPTLVQSRQSQLDNRDIVLCLDVSGSMSRENLAIVRTFRHLAASLHGERISLVLFNSLPLVMFPLTDDYDLVRTRLEDTERSLADAGSLAPDIAAGAYDRTLGQSLVGDGLMSCTEQFRSDAELAALQAAAGLQQPTPDAVPVGRSRMVVLATDNKQGNAGGHQLFTVAEAAERAGQLGAAVMVLDANTEPDSAEALELAAAAAATGGHVYPSTDGGEAVDAIDDAIARLESQTVTGPVVTSAFEVPEQALGLLLPLVVGLVVVWRVVRP
jgi:Mg-chelatase subunit ChlD